MVTFEQIDLFCHLPTFTEVMEQDGPAGPPLHPPLDPPVVLQPGKLGLAGPRPEKIDGHTTSAWSYGGMHGFTYGWKC